MQHVQGARCGALLTKVDAGKESLQRRVKFDASDVVSYSPVTKARAGGEGMTLAELCAAAMTMSDNTAGNMILRAIGGPPAVGAFARTLGDDVTRLDRWETELNEATPGDPRDTTTPAAMAADLQKLALGDALSRGSRAQFVAWLVANTTGGAKLRAGVPEDWTVGDKTGGGDHGAMADIAMLVAAQPQAARRRDLSHGDRQPRSTIATPPSRASARRSPA